MGNLIGSLACGRNGRFFEVCSRSATHHCMKARVSCGGVFVCIIMSAQSIAPLRALTQSAAAPRTWQIPDGRPLSNFGVRRFPAFSGFSRHRVFVQLPAFSGFFRLFPDFSGVFRLFPAFSGFFRHGVFVHFSCGCWRFPAWVSARPQHSVFVVADEKHRTPNAQDN